MWRFGFSFLLLVGLWAQQLLAITTRRMTQATPQRPWAQWYGLQRWRNRAALQMKQHPLCVVCLAQNKVTAATTADHITRHQGDPIEFWFGALQSLCSPCHSKTKQQMELQGFVNDIGIDGWPSDDNHPVYHRKR